MFKVIIVTMYQVIIGNWINEMRDSHGVKGRREELGIFCYEVPALRKKWDTVISRGELD